MRTILNLVVAGGLLSPTTSAVATDVSSALADHRLLKLDGGELRLADLHGQVVLVNFWASWCPPCRKELPQFDAWSREWGEGVRVVAISIDRDEENCRRFVEQAELGIVTCLDGPDGLARKLDLPALPTSYVLDTRGQVVLTVEGAAKESLEKIRSVVEGMLSTTTAASSAAVEEAKR